MTTPERPERKPVIVAVVLNGTGPFRVEDLPLEAVDRIAKANDVTWLTVVGAPLSDLAVANDVVGAVATHLSYPVPEGLSVRALTALFTVVPDDIPDDVPRIAEDDNDPDPFGSSGSAT